MRVSVVLPMGMPSEVVGTARFAEETGFDGVWMYENLYAAGVFAAAGVAITATSRIRVESHGEPPTTQPGYRERWRPGSAPPRRGSLALGLGASPAELVGRLGIDATKPLTVMARPSPFCRSRRRPRTANAMARGAARPSGSASRQTLWPSWSAEESGHVSLVETSGRVLRALDEDRLRTALRGRSCDRATPGDGRPGSDARLGPTRLVNAGRRRDRPPVIATPVAAAPHPLRRRPPGPPVAPPPATSSSAPPAAAAAVPGSAGRAE